MSQRRPTFANVRSVGGTRPAMVKGLWGLQKDNARLRKFLADLVLNDDTRTP